jgi:hypothetical protein
MISFIFVDEMLLENEIEKLNDVWGFNHQKYIYLVLINSQFF